MKIIRVEITNYKKIKVFDVILNGKNLVVAGSPNEGKTTAVSALWEVTKSVADAIMHGEKKGVIRVTLGEPEDQYRIFAERVYTPSGNTINITNNDGRKLSAGTVKDLLNKISSDPLALLDKKGNELTKFLLGVAELPEGFDIAKLDSERAELETKRLDANRLRDVLKKQAGDAPEKVEETDTQPIIDELKTVSDHNAKIEVAKEKYKTIKQEETNNNAAIDEWLIEIDQYKTLIETLEHLVDNGRAKSKEIDEKIIIADNWLIENEEKSSEEIKTKLDSANENNKKVAVFEQWVKKNNERTCAELEYKQLDKKVKEIDQKKKDGLANAKFPVEGLNISDNKVYYNDCLLENCGTEIQIKVSAALVASQTSGIKVMRIDRAESMGQKERNWLLETCKELGVQVCMSRVAEEKIYDNEIQIVDGEYIKE